MQKLKILFLTSVFIAVGIYSSGQESVCADHSLVGGAADAVQKNECILTVFIHGTVLPYTSLKAFRKGFKEHPVADSWYEKYLDCLKHGLGYRYQPMGELGLHLIDEDANVPTTDIGYVAQQQVGLYRVLHQRLYPENKATLVFYTFNWSGRLSHKRRVAAAQDLYKALMAEVEKIQKNVPNMVVKIQLITHSHGGNVALNLAAIDQKTSCPLSIEKLIMFGCPVQQETAQAIKNPMFKTIYHFYSAADYIQVVDCISTKDCFSQRTFTQGKHAFKELPKNVHQIEVVVDEVKPSHCELYLWGLKWLPGNIYRSSFGLCPMPVAVFTPKFIEMIDANTTMFEGADSVTMAICTKQDTVTCSVGKKMVSAALPVTEFTELIGALCKK